MVGTTEAVRIEEEELTTIPLALRQPFNLGDDQLSLDEGYAAAAAAEH